MELQPKENRSVTAVLSASERAAKARLRNCFVSQHATLRYFALGVERYRVAPSYDFTQPPHPGRLFYENFYWCDGGASSAAVEIIQHRIGKMRLRMQANHLPYLRQIICEPFKAMIVP